MFEKNLRFRALTLARCAPSTPLVLSRQSRAKVWHLLNAEGHVVASDARSARDNAACISIGGSENPADAGRNCLASPRDVQ